MHNFSEMLALRWGHRLLIIMFICGQNGCFVIEINEDARRYAAEQRLKWAWEQKRKTGKFPPIEEQSEYMQAAYERHINLGPPPF